MTGSPIPLVRSLLFAPTGVRPGYMHAYQLAQPAAGQGISHAAPADYYEMIMAVSGQLATSAAVANRVVQADLLNADNVLLARSKLTGAVAAASASTFFGYPGAATQTQGAGTSVAPLWQVILPPGWQFALTVAALDIADQLSGVTLLVARYPAQWASGDTGRAADELADELAARLAHGG